MSLQRFLAQVLTDVQHSSILKEHLRYSLVHCVSYLAFISLQVQCNVLLRFKALAFKTHSGVEARERPSAS